MDDPTSMIERDVEACAEARIDLIRNDPTLIERISEGGAFGGENSRAASVAMFSRDHPGAVEDLRAKAHVAEVAPRSWLMRLPKVNSADRKSTRLNTSHVLTSYAALCL